LLLLDSKNVKTINKVLNNQGKVNKQDLKRFERTKRIFNNYLFDEKFNQTTPKINEIF
jgi:hypothetical protein